MAKYVFTKTQFLRNFSTDLSAKLVVDVELMPDYVLKVFALIYAVVFELSWKYRRGNIYPPPAPQRSVLHGGKYQPPTNTAPALRGLNYHTLHRIRVGRERCFMKMWKIFQ